MIGKRIKVYLGKMKKNNLKDYLVKTSKYQRQGLAFLAIVVFLIISKTFPTQVMTSDDCTEGKCEQLIEEPSLSDEENLLFLNDQFSSQQGKFYRLSFRAKSNKDSEIFVKMSNVLDRETLLKEIELKKSPRHNFEEIIFQIQTDEGYTDILFEKPNQDGAEIEISNVQISKLEIESEEEAANLIPTIFGELNFQQSYEIQANNDKTYDQLKEPDLILGQVFKSPVDFIAEVELDIGVVKQGTGDGDEYKLVLKEVDMAANMPEVLSGKINSVSFSAASIEKFRQLDGKFRFPIYARVEKNKFYFIGIENDRVDVNEFNYLEIQGFKGSGNETGEGTVVKKRRLTYPVFGDLYLKIYGLEFVSYQGHKILFGTVIEDFGQGQGLYSYQSLGKIYDLADLDSFTKDIYFNEKNKAIAGEKKGDKKSEFIFSFPTVFPMRTIRILAKQADLTWDKAKLEYSFDEKNWIQVPEVEGVNNDSQVFDYKTTVNQDKNLFYLRVSPKEDPETEEEKKKVRYGLRDLKVEAKLEID